MFVIIGWYYFVYRLLLVFWQLFTQNIVLTLFCLCLFLMLCIYVFYAALWLINGWYEQISYLSIPFSTWLPVEDERTKSSYRPILFIDCRQKFQYYWCPWYRLDVSSCQECGRRSDSKASHSIWPQRGTVCHLPRVTVAAWNSLSSALRDSVEQSAICPAWQ